MSRRVGQLIVQLQGQVLETLALGAPTLRIGRLPDNDLVLSSPLVARAHAVVHVQAGEALLTDLGSRHGTYLQGSRLPAHQPTRLADGDHYQIGGYVLTYLAGRTAGIEPGPELDGLLGTVTTAPVPVQEALARWEARLPLNAPPLPTPLSRYLQFLPGLFQDADFFGRFLKIFERLWEPHEWRQDHIEMYFDPRTAPAEMLPVLAAWLGVPIRPHWPEERARRILHEATDLHRWRGTAYGLGKLLELTTGLTVQVEEDAFLPFVFRVQVQRPAGTADDPGEAEHLAQEIELLIQRHKPAHAGYLLEIT